jgi:hypothetical protein
MPINAANQGFRDDDDDTREGCTDAYYWIDGFVSQSLHLNYLRLETPKLPYPILHDQLVDLPQRWAALVLERQAQYQGTRICGGVEGAKEITEACWTTREK